MLREYLAAFQLFTEAEILQFEACTYPKTISKGEYFIKEGAVSDEVAFILSGAFRSYYHASNEEEVTYCFTFANSFVTAYSSFISHSPTRENIQALTDAQLLVISKKNLERLQSQSVNWIKFRMHMAEQEYLLMEQRIFVLQKESAEKRYKDMQLNHSQLIQEIP